MEKNFSEIVNYINILDDILNNTKEVDNMQLAKIDGFIITKDKAPNFSTYLIKTTLDYLNKDIINIKAAYKDNNISKISIESDNINIMSDGIIFIIEHKFIHDGIIYINHNPQQYLLHDLDIPLLLPRNLARQHNNLNELIKTTNITEQTVRILLDIDGLMANGRLDSNKCNTNTFNQHRMNLLKILVEALKLKDAKVEIDVLSTATLTNDKNQLPYEVAKFLTQLIDLTDSKAILQPSYSGIENEDKNVIFTYTKDNNIIKIKETDKGSTLKHNILPGTISKENSFKELQKIKPAPINIFFDNDPDNIKSVLHKHPNVYSIILPSTTSNATIIGLDDSKQEEINKQIEKQIIKQWWEDDNYTEQFVTMICTQINNKMCITSYQTAAVIKEKILQQSIEDKINEIEEDNYRTSKKRQKTNNIVTDLNFQNTHNTNPIK